MQKTYEVEKEANSTLVKTRFEFDQVIKSIKNFKGSKDEERKKITELNSTYGEAFGYYETLSQWYDTLMQKSSDYIQVLVLEQKARKWIDQAVEEGDKADKIKSEGVEVNRPWFGKGGKISKFFGGSTTNQFGSSFIMEQVRSRFRMQKRWCCSSSARSRGRRKPGPAPLPPEILPEKRLRFGQPFHLGAGARWRSSAAAGIPRALPDLPVPPWGTVARSPASSWLPELIRSAPSAAASSVPGTAAFFCCP